MSKKFERTEALAGTALDEFTVYNPGTLVGEWLRRRCHFVQSLGRPLHCPGGKIVRMEVWNDSAEPLLLRAGLIKK